MNNCLANTGTNVVITALIALVFIAVSIFVLSISRSRTYRIYFGVLFLIGGLFGVVSTIPAHASAASAQECGSSISTAIPDTSSGIAGTVQKVSVIDNDTAASGKSFVLSSLRLSLRNNPVAGSTLSSDAKTVTVPGEGMYIAGGDGTISFTPDAGFVGTAVGVAYSVQDTVGGTTTSTYTPTVTATVATCSDPGSESRVLGAFENSNLMVLSSGDTINYYSAPGSFAGSSLNSPALIPQDIDLDPTTPGVQQTLTFPNAILTYDATQDQIKITVTTDYASYYANDANTIQNTLSYTIRAATNCQQPAPAPLRFVAYVSIP